MSEDVVPYITPPAWPHQMIADMAYGMEEPVEIAYRYGFKASEFRALEEHQPFLAAVAAARSELERSGHGVKAKAQWMTENLMDDLYIRAKSPHASIGQIQDSIKILSKLADLEPKGNVMPNSAGPGFSVVINIPTAGGKADEKVVSQATLTFPAFAKPAEAESVEVKE